MSIARKAFFAACALTGAWTIHPVLAQAPAKPAQPSSSAAAAVDEDEAFDDQLREFGYWSGAAFGCVEPAKQADVERQVMDTFHNIGRLFGTDRAFFYAAAFGNGTTVTVEPARCPEFLDKFQKATALRGRK